MERGAFIRLGIVLAATETWLTSCGNGADDSPSGPPRSSPAETGVAGGGGTGATGGGAGLTAAGTGAGDGSSQCSTDAMLTSISSESHDHLPLSTPIAAAELNAGSPTEYGLPLEQDHTHTLAFTASDFAQLRAGMTISKRSSTELGHTHTYSVSCV